VLEVTWLDGLDVARAKALVDGKGPHWKAGESVDEEDKPDKQLYKSGSKKPAAYALEGATPTVKLRVKVKVTVSEKQPAKGKLTGQLGVLRFEGDCPAAAGTHTVEVTAKGVPDVVRHFEGDVQWTLATFESFCNLKNLTRLEMFLVLKKPLAFFTPGVWAEALRFLFRKAYISNVKTEKDVARWITRHCHGPHGMVYDTDRGAPQFGAEGDGAPSFQLMNYMAKKGRKGNTVNCFDQAAAIQSLNGAMGVTLAWNFVRPFGYINMTNLVGVGPCNNPFYGVPPAPMVDADSADRNGFICHAFASLSGKVLDACAGPHLGDETLREYLVASIDVGRSRLEPDYGIRHWDSLAGWSGEVPATSDSDYLDFLETYGSFPQGGVTGVV
jgi:hypothetical protein